jgi:hypothetical protein
VLGDRLLFGLLALRATLHNVAQVPLVLHTTRDTARRRGVGRTM